VSSVSPPGFCVWLIIYYQEAIFFQPLFFLTGILLLFLILIIHYFVDFIKKGKKDLRTINANLF
ncbi:MAG: hypothetical protein PWP02_878, partial [Thermosipho sp. (in: thermotogales)]|nr:hypothetical protein [Thermosipho sp. (in: thermotogales)]